MDLIGLYFYLWYVKLFVLVVDLEMIGAGGEFRVSKVYFCLVNVDISLLVLYEFIGSIKDIKFSSLVWISILN